MAIDTPEQETVVTRASAVRVATAAPRQAAPWVAVRVLVATVKREWQVFLRYPMNAVMRLVEPIMWLTPVYFLGVSFSQGERMPGFEATTGTSNFLSFVLLGSIVASYISAVLWGIGFALKQQMDEGTLEAIWLTPNSRLWLLVGRSVFGVLITGLNTASVLVLAHFLFGFHLGGPLGPALLVLVPTVVALYGFGFAYAAVVLFAREANFLTDVGSFLLQVLCGVNFPVTALPRVLMVVAVALPVTYALDLMRTLVLNTRPLVAVPIAAAILVVSAAGFVLLGVRAFAAMERRVRAAGTVGMH